jgi:hypothetical protein
MNNHLRHNGVILDLFYWSSYFAALFLDFITLLGILNFTVNTPIDEFLLTLSLKGRILLNGVYWLRV